MTTVVDSDEYFLGIAYDPSNKKIYYSQYIPGQIYRANVDGSGVETLASNVDCELNFFFTCDISVDERVFQCCVFSGYSSGSIRLGLGLDDGKPVRRELFQQRHLRLQHVIQQFDLHNYPDQRELFQRYCS